MKKYRVSLVFTCVSTYEVEAENKNEAILQARRNWDSGMEGIENYTDPEPYEEMDMAEEICP